MKQIIMFLVLCAFSFSCITTTTALMSNTTYDLQSNTCLYIVDLNLTINWTPKNYNINTTILDGGTYYNSEANIQITTPADKCIDRNWTSIVLNASQIYPDSATHTFYQCTANPSCPSYPPVTYYNDPGTTRLIIDRNVTCIANACSSPPANYCYQNYYYTANINTTQRYQYTNYNTNTTIDIQFTAPTCSIIYVTNVTYVYNNTNCTNETVYQNVTVPFSLKTITPACGTTTVDDERSVIIQNSNCFTPLTGTLNLPCGQSYTYSSPHNLAITTTPGTVNTTCPACQECQVCSIYSSNTSATINTSKLLEYDGENCTSKTEVCRDYFYELSCTQQEADDGDLPACVSRVYYEKDTTIANCNSETQSCQAAKTDLQEQYDKVKKDQEWVMWIVGGIILLIAMVVGIPFAYYSMSKAGLVESKRITPNPKIPEKKDEVK